MKIGLHRGLLTARLWALFWGSPPRHPLFVMRFRHLTPIRHRPAWLNSLLVTVFGTLACVFSTFVPVMTILIGALFLGFMIAVPFGGTLRGLITAGAAARGIGLEGQDPARMALFQIMPPGQLGISWLLGMRAVRLSRHYRNFALLVTLMQVGVGGLLLLGVGFLAIYPAESYDYGIWNVIIPAALFGGFIVWVLADNLQAPILGFVCGLWGSTFSTQVMVAWAASVGVYLSLILACAAGTALSIHVLAWLLPIDSSVLDIWVNILTLLLTPFVSVTFREAAIRGMWAWVCRRMNADGSEVGML